MPSRSSHASAQPAPDRPGGSDAPVLPGLVFDNHYARLPDRFFVRMDPVPVAHPALVAFNTDLAAELGLDAAGMEPHTLAAILSGNRVPQGAEPLAQAYAGHQFGQFVPQLGDGRAILLGEVIDRAGRRRDLQLKGAGRTPFSRRGDGRAALGPVLREFVVSEAMHALGVPTTRALAAVTTGEAVQRETALPGAVLTRVAASHIRVGTFQFFAARGDTEALRLLLDHAIARHAPEAAAAEHPARAFLEAVAAVQADLIARWMGLGFIHGVMNTDNMTVSGETIDYGPCAFLDAYDPGACFSAIDQFGRYAYANQPRIAQWNLARLAEALLPLLDPDPNAAIEAANVIIAAFAGRYEAAVARVLRAKFGLTRAMEGDAALLRDGLAALEAGGADFTLAFRRLADLAAVIGDPGGKAGPRRRRARSLRCVSCSPMPRRWICGSPAGGSGSRPSRRPCPPRALPRCASSIPRASRATIASRKRCPPPWSTVISRRSSGCAPRSPGPSRMIPPSRNMRRHRVRPSASARPSAAREDGAVPVSPLSQSPC